MTTGYWGRHSSLRVWEETEPTLFQWINFGVDTAFLAAGVYGLGLMLLS
jgi:hypothetical protein